MTQNAQGNLSHNAPSNIGQYSILFQAIEEPIERSRQLRLAQLSHDADLIDETLLQVLRSLSDSIQVDVAWFRALRIFLDLQQPQPLDMLSWQERPLTSIRIESIAAIPDLTSLEGADQINMVISNAIHKGAPIYNNGNPRGCAVLYYATALTLVNAPTIRAFAGQARSLKPLRQVLEEPLPPQIARDTDAIEEFAWRMRRALDTTLAALT